MNDERKIMPESPALEERLRVLKETIPECFSEGRLDSDKLKDVLGEDNLDAGQERYGLNWPGKREARARAFKPSTMALHYAKGEGVNEKTTKNLIIEGENLEVLRLLLKPYRGRIKMIYIDPPYNTGNDFIYDDKFAEDSTKYEIRAGLRGEDGIALQTNRRSSGRYHSNWLSMIYPRLMLARELLSDDGILFISIDGNEEANLVNVASEIFGEENHICSFVWQKRYAPPPDTKEIGFTHESIIAFKKSEKFVRSLLPLSEEQKARYKNPDNDPRGPWKAADYTCRYTYTERPNLYYSIKNPNTGKDIWPKKTRVWANSKEVHRQNEIEKRIWWGSDGNNDVPALKNFLSDIQAGIMPTSLLLHEKVGHTDEATKELRELIPEVKFTPKPTRLIKYLMSISSLSPDSVVLDFFAGTGTTAQAVLEKNVEDGTYCQFVLVQIPEPMFLYKAAPALLYKELGFTAAPVDPDPVDPEPEDPTDPQQPPATGDLAAILAEVKAVRAILDKHFK